MKINKMNEVVKQIEKLKEKGLSITRANLASLINMHISSYCYNYIDDEVNEYINKVSAEQKQQELFKNFTSYVDQLAKEKKAITYANIAVLHGVSASRAKIVFKDSLYKDYMKQVKAKNKILSAKEKFQEFYSLHAPFTKFKNMKASDIFEAYGKDYFESVQHYTVFAKHYGIPFKRVNKTNPEE